MSHRETLKRPGRMMRAGLFLAGAVFLLVCVTANQVHAAPIIFNVTTPNPTFGNLSGTFTMTFDPSPPNAFQSLDAWNLTVTYNNNGTQTTSFSGSTAINTSDFNLTNSDGNLLAIRPINNSSGVGTGEWDSLGGTFDWILGIPIGVAGGDGSYSPVPEPGTALLVATGLIGLAGYRWQLRRHEKIHLG